MQLRLIRYFLIFVLAINCYKAQNRLHVFSANGEPFGLKVDSQMINATPQAHVRTGLVSKDTLHIDICFPYLMPFKTKVYLLAKKKPVKNMEFTYAVEKTKTSYRLRFINVSAIKKMPEPLVPEKPIEDTSWKINNNILEHYCELKDGKPIYFNNLSEKNAMPDSYLGHAVRLMNRMRQEDDKLQVIEQTLLRNHVTSIQLKKLIAGVPYELDKLKLIRLAYPNVVDKQNLNALTEMFAYESSKRELSDFLKAPDLFKAPAITKECPVASEENVINDLVVKLKQLQEDNLRVELIRKSSKEYCYTIEHMRSVLKTFIHDRERLEATKIMYYTCVKKEDVIQLSDLFSYAETEVALKRFLEQFEK